jgi:hypothetical protein
MTYAKRFLFLLLGLAAATAASAQLLEHGAPKSNLLDSSALAQEVTDAMKAAQQSPNTESAKDAVGVVVNRGAASTAAKKLAASYPAKARTEVERVFGVLLETYPKVEQKLGMPANELGGAVALLLVTSLQAYQGRDVQPEQFKAVAAQMRGILSANPGIAQAPDSEKQEMYEQLAILGLFLDGVHEALQKTPNAQIAANMKQAAKGYLEQFLKTDVEDVDITAQGLVLKGAAAARDSTAPVGKEPVGKETPAAPPKRPDAVAAVERDDAAPAADGARRIEAVVLDQNWGMGIGGSMVLRYDPMVLFSDGTYTSDADAALTAAAKMRGRWRKEGANYLLTDAKGKVEKVPTKLRTRPARAKQTLSGRFHSFSALGGGTTGTAMVAAWRDFNFAPDGTVRFDRGAGASTNDQKGGPTDPGASVVTRSSASSTGRYSLDGHTITLAFDDGKKEQKLFYFFPDSEGTIGVGSSTYSNSH